jgi:hypothetical protein
LGSTLLQLFLLRATPILWTISLMQTAVLATRRYDYIVRPRGIPFAPPPTVTIRNYFEFNSAFREKGKEMIIIIPRDVSDFIYDRLLSHAEVNEVLVGGHFRDMWND